MYFLGIYQHQITKVALMTGAAAKGGLGAVKNNPDGMCLMDVRGIFVGEAGGVQ